MKRFFRIATLVASGLVVLVLAAVLAIRLLLPPEKALALLEQQLEARLGREFKLGSLTLVGVSTFRVTNVQISEPPTFQAGTFLTADAFEIKAQLLPLLFRRLVIKSVSLDNPTLTIIRSADGRLNVAGSSAEKSATVPKAKPTDILISEVRLSRGSLTFVDKSTAALSAVIEPIDVTLKHVSLAAPVAVSGRVGILVRRIRSETSFEGTYNPLRSDATLERFVVKTASATLEARGHVSALTSGSPNFSGTLAWKNLDPASFSALAPLPPGLNLNGPISGSLDVSGTVPSISGKFNGDFTQAGLAWKEVVNKAAGVPLTVRMSLDRNSAGDLTLHDLSLRLASIHLEGAGTLRGSSDTARTASFRVETNAFDITDLFANIRAPMPAGVTMSGLVKATATMEGWTGGGRFVADFDGTGLAAGYGEAFQKAPGTTFRLVADGRYATPLAVDLSSVRLDLDKLTMNGRGSYTTGKVRPTYVFRLKTNVFPLTTLSTLVPDARAYTPTGDAVVNMRVSRGAAGPLISGDATLLSAGATIKQAKISDLAGALEFTNDSVTTAKLTGKIQGDPLQMSLRATRLLARPLLEADIRAAKLDIGKLLASPEKKTWILPRFQWAPFPASVAEAADTSPPFIFDTKGTLRAGAVLHPDFVGKDLDLDWDLTSVTAEMNQISGKAKLRQGAGEAKNIRSLIEGSKAARLLLSPLTVLQRIDDATNGALKIPSLESFPFTAISGNYAMKNGVATIAPMTLSSSILNSQLEGTIGLSGQQLTNLRVTVTADSKAIGGIIGDALASVGKTHTIPMTVTGPLLSPSVSVDKSVVQDKAKDVLKSLGESLFKSLSR